MSFSVQDQHVVVLGAGKSGRAAAELLMARGARVTVSDTAAEVEDAAALRALGVLIEVGPHRPELLTAADMIVLSPGIPPVQDAILAARAAGVPVVGELELASRWLRGRIIAITGTKGKSTTTTLTARMLREAGFDAPAGGNIGNALSAQVATSRPETLHVVEVSSFQLESTESFHPWISVLLNLSPDHLDRHADFAEYGEAKARIFANQTANDWAVVNADDAGAMALAEGGRAQRCDFGLDAAVVDGVTVAGASIVRRTARGDETLSPLALVKVPGRHLLADVLAASAASSLAGAPPDAIQRAIASFHGLEHALERVGEIGGVQFVNDSKATNIASAKRSIESFDRGVVVILGGKYKGGRFEDLQGALQDHADAVVAIGEARPIIREGLGGVGPIAEAGSMGDAVRMAFSAASPGGVVLLAPACASFDMFRDYAARGRAFRDEVAKLAEAWSNTTH